MPPTLRLRPTAEALAARGSQVEAPEAPNAGRPSRRPFPTLRLKPATLEARLEAFTYHASTTAVVAETDDYVEVADGPPDSGLCTGERRAHDGTWSEEFVQQTGVRGGAGAGKGKKGNGKGSGSTCRDFGRRKGRNVRSGQRWKEAWEKTEEEGGVVRLEVERHVQEVDDPDSAEAEVLQEWDEHETWQEPGSGGSSSSSSSAAASSSAAPGADGEVLSMHRWVQTGRDRRSGRTWRRTVTRRRVRREQEVVSESEEELEETEVNGDSRGNARHRIGQSLDTSEWGAEQGGRNRWRSNYSLQTLVSATGEIRGREWVRKWYDNGEEEQTEEWETLDDFEREPGASASAASRAGLRLQRRIRSGRKDGKQHHGEQSEWHERWEEQELPVEGEPGALRLRRRKVEKWWRENAKNNSWGEHHIDQFDRNGGSERGEHRKWYDNGEERQDERWVELPDGSAEGSKEGSRGGHTWGERWIRKCDGTDGQVTVDKWHDDGLGTKVERKEGRRWQNSKDVEWHHEEIGQVVGQGESWVVKVGGNEKGDEWYEMWKDKQAEKSAEKRGKNAQGDTWREAWTEEFDAAGVRVRQKAEKEGSNAQGDVWYETWIEEQERKKQALKKGRNAAGAEWQEEWGEEARPDGSGNKWTSKWADDGLGGRWGDNWGDEWHAEGGGKRWVEKWDNKGKSDKHSHDTDGRPEH